MASRTGWARLMNLGAFVALTLIGVSLLLSWAFTSSQLTNAFMYIAQVLAYVIVAFYALVFAIERRRSQASFITCLVLWTISVVLIVIFLIL